MTRIDSIYKGKDRFITFVENEDGSFRSFDQLVENTNINY